MSSTKEKIEKTLGRKITNQEITRLNNIGKRLIKERGKGADGETKEELEALVVHRYFIIARKEDRIKKRKEAIKVIEKGQKQRATKKPSINAARTLYQRAMKTKNEYYVELNEKYFGPNFDEDWEEPANFMSLTKAEQKKVKTLNNRVDDNFKLFTELSKEQGQADVATKMTYQQIVESLK